MTVDPLLGLPSWILSDPERASAIERHVQRAADAFLDHRLGVMIGAGASIPAHAPSGRAVITEALATMYGSAVEAEDLNQVDLAGLPFEVVLAALDDALEGTSSLEDWVRFRLYDGERDAGAAYKELAQLANSSLTPGFGVGSLRRIFTTNFDTFIEQELGGEATVSERNLEELSHPPANAVQVVHVHGVVTRERDKGHDGTLVATEKRLFDPKGSRMRYRLQEEMMSSDVFAFVGYSMSDANLRAIYHQFRADIEGSAEAEKPVLFVLPFQEHQRLDYYLARHVAETRSARLIPCTGSAFFASIVRRVQDRTDLELAARVAQHLDVRGDTLGMTQQRLANALSLNPEDALAFLAHSPNAQGAFLLPPEPQS